MKRQQQKGFVLFIVMIFLIVMSLLGVSMYSGFIKDQKMAGNMREKQRAIEAAQANLDMVEKWLQNTDNVYEGGWKIALSCNSTNQAAVTPVICSNPLDTPATLPWPSGQGQAFTPPSSTMAVTASGGANSYASNPQYYVQEMDHTDNTAWYKVTSTAQGGNATAATVIETIYEVKCLSCKL
jgi:type IV pilus assembly protein PilX